MFQYVTYTYVFLFPHRKKRQMEARYGIGCSNELDLFHGTMAQHVDTICNDNLDFRLAGDRVGALFGQGSYFAVEAKYSDLYCQPAPNRHKFMFVVKCLAGKCAQGDPKFKRPPPVDPKDAQKGLYDCCVDNPANPKIYCIFDNHQYYPEYIIEYMWSFSCVLPRVYHRVHVKLVWPSVFV